MSSFLSALMLRVFAGGLICTAAMLLAGDGAKKEVVRICCACLMIIFVLTPLTGAQFSLADFSVTQKEVERQIQNGLDEARQSEYNATAAAITDYIRSKSEKLDINCQPQVEYLVDENNVFHITSVTVTHTAVGQSAIDALKKIITDECGVPLEQIYFIER